MQSGFFSEFERLLRNDTSINRIHEREISRQVHRSVREVVVNRLMKGE
jgi:hypothetical protein